MSLSSIYDLGIEVHRDQRTTRLPLMPPMPSRLVVWASNVPTITPDEARCKGIQPKKQMEEPQRLVRSGISSTVPYSANYRDARECAAFGTTNWTHHHRGRPSCFRRSVSLLYRYRYKGKGKTDHDLPLMEVANQVFRSVSLQRGDGVALTMYNTDESIYGFCAQLLQYGAE